MNIVQNFLKICVIFIVVSEVGLWYARYWTSLLIQNKHCRQVRANVSRSKRGYAAGRSFQTYGLQALASFNRCKTSLTDDFN